jgi:methionyl-tRNA synthetase
MSKSRGNFLDPADLVSAFGIDGARYVTLREIPFDSDADVSWESFVRRYNADLANDFGNLVNRTISMTNRYLGGERPSPTNGSLADVWGDRLPQFVDAMEGCLLHQALSELWELVGAANRHVDAEKPWELAKAAKGGDAAAEERLRGVLGDLLEACRVVALAAAPFLPSSAPGVLGQLGLAYDYGPDGNGGPALLDALAWGAATGEPGRVAAPEPLFPRLETEAVESTSP